MLLCLTVMKFQMLAEMYWKRNLLMQGAHQKALVIGDIDGRFCRGRQKLLALNLEGVLTDENTPFTGQKGFGLADRLHA